LPYLTALARKPMAASNWMSPDVLRNAATSSTAALGQLVIDRVRDASACIPAQPSRTSERRGAAGGSTRRPRMSRTGRRGSGRRDSNVVDELSDRSSPVTASAGWTIRLMLHYRVRPGANQPLSAIVVTDGEDRLLVLSLTDLDD
jgi:hypothetical protein